MKEDFRDEFIKPAEDDFGFLLWRIMKLWQRERQRDLDEFKTTVSQLELLGAIYYLNNKIGEVTQIVLSQETGIDPMTTSTILRNLEKKDLVIRKHSKVDTRARVVESTNAGNELLFTAINKMSETQKKLLEDIDAQSIKSELKKLLIELENRTFNDNNR